MDGISARIWKESAEELSYPLALLFNVSLNSGRVSSSWKRANVTPVFKAGATDLVENYRSISSLSISTKCRSFYMAAPKLWNDLPLFIRNISSVNAFKKALKTHLFQKAFPS